MSDTDVIDSGGPSLSADEEAFFSSGGEKAIPGESSGDAGADTGAAGGGEGGEAKPADGEAKPGETKPKNSDHVPLATFLEEKKARKGLETKAQEMERQLAEFKGKFAIIDRLKLGGEADPEKPAAPPTPEDDIFGAVKHTGETLAQIQKRLDDADAAQKAAGEQKAFVDKYRADAATFEQTAPDFKAAYDFLLNSRAAELKAIGYDTPEALHQALVADEFAIAEMAFAKNKSPAEMIYNLANQRGYKKASPDPDKGKGAEKLDAIERGQAANKSLSNTGGSSGDPDMTAEALIAMPADEFEAWCNKNPAKARRIFGG
jgi:vacuolar-type H+-ATPase subunit I/STV1